MTKPKPDRDDDVIMERYRILRADGKTVKDITALLNAELGLSLGEDAYYSRWKRYRKKHSIEIDDETLREEAKLGARLNFLKRGCTLKTLCGRFRCSVDEAMPYLERNAYEGYEVWQSKNRYNEDCWIAIPKPADPVKPQPKIWTYSVSQDIPLQPWIWVHIPDDFNAEVIKIFLLADLHKGAKTHARGALLEYIGYIAEHDNAFGVGVGDWLENALKTSIGDSVYKQAEHPEIQLHGLQKDMLPIAHKIFWAIPGNHEDRTYNAAGICPLKVFCDSLEIPYFNDQIHMSIFWKGHIFEFFGYHGKTSSRTKGGKINEAMRPRNYQEHVHFRIMAHVHDQISNPVLKMRRNHELFIIEFLKEYVMIAPSFLDYWGSYASKAGMEPGVQGAIACAIYPDGKYEIDPWGD